MCLFEHVYFARPDSLIYGHSVNESRHKMGKRLAIEQPADADLVVPVPDSGTVAAIGYSAQSKHQFSLWAGAQSLRGSHLHRAAAVDSLVSACASN